MAKIRASKKHLDKGGCVCGANRFEAKGKPTKVIYCHCDFCRNQTGAPAVVFVVYNRDQIQFTRGVRRIYESGPGAMRGFCDQCGTPLSWEGDAGGLQAVEFYVGVMDEPEKFPPTLHASVKERLSWFDVNDGLPRYQGSSNEPADPD
jgi:hypothetical protein